MHVDSTNEGTVVVVCKCGAAMCTKCGERMHMPLSCADARFYLNAVETNGSLMCFTVYGPIRLHDYGPSAWP